MFGNLNLYVKADKNADVLALQIFGELHIAGIVKVAHKEIYGICFGKNAVYDVREEFVFICNEAAAHILLLLNESYNFCMSSFLDEFRRSFISTLRHSAIW